MKFPALQYQTRAINHMVSQAKTGLLLLPGRGKTVITLSAFVRLREDFEAARMLVVAPLGVCYNVWGAECAKWDHTQHLRVSILHGKKKAERLTDDADIFAINPEGIPWLAEQRWRWPDMVVFDESTRFKKPGRRRFNAVRKILGKFTRRYILTGTPIPNGMLDLFGQIYLIDQGKTFGTDVTAFKHEFFVPVERGSAGPGGRMRYVWELRRNADTEIYKRLGALVLRLEGDDLDLPDLVVSDVPIELPPAARRIYDTLRADMVAEIEQGEIIALNAGSLTAKCRQISNGRVYLDDLPGGFEKKPDGVAKGRPFAEIHDAKVEAIRGLVDELGGRNVLFAYEFHHDLVALEKAVGRPVPLLRGTDTGLVTRWNRGLERFMVAHPKSAGHGLNLQDGGHVMVWLAPPWDLELYEQMYRRLYRKGQTERVLVYRIVGRDTVDETAARGLALKNATQQALLDALREDLTS